MQTPESSRGKNERRDAALGLRGNTFDGYMNPDRASELLGELALRRHDGVQPVRAKKRAAAAPSKEANRAIVLSTVVDSAAASVRGA